MRKKNNSTTVVLAVIAILLVVLNVVLYKSVILSETPRDAVDMRDYSLDEKDQEPVEPEVPVKKIPDNYILINVNSDEVHFGDLILVNNTTEFVFDGNPSYCKKETPVSVYGLKNKNYTLLDTSIFLNKTVIENLNSLFTDYRGVSGKADIMINSAYRTYDDQAAMLQKKIEQYGEEQGRLVATNPGFSEHHSGLSFDICIFENGRSRTFEEDEVHSYIPQNCHKYGFIQRYPESKTVITGITYEPWHYRYVGVPHSYYINSNGLCLEEYIDIVKSYPFNINHLKIEAGGKNYEVYYVPATDGTTGMYVPADKAYEISGNNVDGFIVTVDMTQFEAATDEVTE